MWAQRIEARGFRNLPDLALHLPADGAVFVGPNGQGKTNLLEALYYPVLFRSFRGAVDADVTSWGEDGFFLALEARSDQDRVREFTCGFLTTGRRKRIGIDGEAIVRLGGAIGQWLAVTFLPADLGLVQGSARGRRHYLDRVLSLADGAYLGSLTAYRQALLRRNAALRQGQRDVAHAFDGALAEHGSVLVAHRIEWVQAVQEQFDRECAALGETMPVHLAYRGQSDLVDRSAWSLILERSLPRDLARRATMTGPHRDDLSITFANRKSFRDFGSRGQHRSAAIALKLCELNTLAAARGVTPVLLLDDVFAELDGDRQARLATRLRHEGGSQTFITAPRMEELPADLDLDVMTLVDGRVCPTGVS